MVFETIKEPEPFLFELGAIAKKNFAIGSSQKYILKSFYKIFF